MLNTDATLDKKQEKARWGIVTRNEHGEVVCTWAGNESKDSKAEIEEADAIRTALTKAK